jgi:cytosine/adenosine deaminase-related metal-dependent hydrolase
MLTIYRARHVVPVSSAPLAEGAVAVEGERIVAVGPADALLARYPQARLVDLGASALLPAAVNAHTHLELTGLAGTLPPGLPFADWIVALVRARRPLGQEQLTQAAAEGIARLRASGTAAVGEISTAGASVAPLVESGLRGIVYYELLSGDPAQARAVLRRGQEQLERWRRAYPRTRLRFGLSLHAPYTVSAPLFELASAWCAAEGVPLCIHAAESPAESQWLLDRTGPIADTLYRSLGLPTNLEPAPGCSPVRYLHELGVLRAQPLLVHGVQVDEDDLALLSGSDVAVAHCPRSNAWLQCGRMPYDAYRAAGVRLALGTDSLASAPSLSLWDEAAAAWQAHVAAGELADPHELLRLVTLEGAAALGLEHELGTLEVGKVAELACASLIPLSSEERASCDLVVRALWEGRLAIRGISASG